MKLISGLLALEASGAARACLGPGQRISDFGDALSE
jgi:hypothetical protein